MLRREGEDGLVYRINSKRNNKTNYMRKKNVVRV